MAESGALAVLMSVSHPHQKQRGSLFHSCRLRFRFPGFGGGAFSWTRARTRSTRRPIFLAVTESRES